VRLSLDVFAPEWGQAQNILGRASERTEPCRVRKLVRCARLGPCGGLHVLAHFIFLASIHSTGAISAKFVCRGVKGIPPDTHIQKFLKIDAVEDAIRVNSCQ
jgi:hypothetical protein